MQIRFISMDFKQMQTAAVSGGTSHGGNGNW